MSDNPYHPEEIKHLAAIITGGWISSLRPEAATTISTAERDGLRDEIASLIHTLLGIPKS